MFPAPSRGDVFWADLNPVKGHEQAGTRPVLIVSIDELNHSPVRRTVIVPITSQGSKRAFRVEQKKNEGGLADAGWILCDQIRSISIERLGRYSGHVDDETLEVVLDQLALLLGI